MDVTIPRAALLALVERARKCADPKSAMPILSHLHIVAAGETITVSATDLVLSFTGTRPAKVKRPGSVCVPARLFRDVLARMPEGDVRIVIDKHRISLSCAGQRRADSLVAMPGEDFPTMPRPEGDAHTIPAAALADLRRLTRHAMSLDETRPHLAAALLTLTPGEISAVATDGHRVVVATRRAPSVTRVLGGSVRCLVPSVAMDRMALPEDGDITLTINGTKGSDGHARGPVFFTVATPDGSEIWGTKLVDAAFPSYEQVIPSGTPTWVTCSRAELLDALSAVATIAVDRTGGVKLSQDGDRLHIFAENVDAGEMTDDIAADFDGPVQRIGFNSTYLTDVLGSLRGERVKLGFFGELDPAMVACPDEGPAFTAVVMPMRI